MKWRGVISNVFDLSNNVLITAYGGNQQYVLDTVVPVSGFDQNGVFYYDTQFFYKLVVAENDFAYTP